MGDQKQLDTNSVPSLPVEDILVNVANSVVQAQQVLDTNSLNSEIRIREAELDKQFGLSATWYTIPELDFDLRLAFELGSRGEVTTQMVDAEYQSKYGFNVKASSDLNTRIVSTPPAEGEGLRLLDEKVVLKRIGNIKSIVQAYDSAETPYFVVRYQPFSRQGYAGGLWFVLLVDTLLTGQTEIKALAVVDDTTAKILRVWINQAITVDGVEFTADEALTALVIINTVPEEVLRDEIGIYSSAVDLLLAQRPFTDFVTVSEVRGMGRASMEKLYEYMLSSWQPGAGDRGDQSAPA